MATALGIIGILGTGLSAGYSAYSYSQQASAAQQIANYNYATQAASAQAQMQLAIANAQFQARLAQHEAGLNAYMSELQAQGYEANAQAIENKILTDDSATREDIRTQRDEFNRLISSQRAQIAKSGVAEAGTPLDILAETAGDAERVIQNMAYENELQRRSGFYEADIQRYQADQARYQGSVTQFLGNAEAQGYGIQEVAASIGYQNDLARANIDRLTGTNAASNYRAQATGSILSGLSSIGRGAYDLYQNTGFRSI